MTKRWFRGDHCTWLVLSLAFAALAGGCQLRQGPVCNPLAGPGAVTTPSVDAARAAQRTHEPVVRAFAEFPARYADRAVTHGPLYFEDPWLDRRSKTGDFSWTGDDYLCFVYSPVRFMVNALATPVSALVAPPWRLMASDGQPSRTILGSVYDAEAVAP